VNQRSQARPPQLRGDRRSLVTAARRNPRPDTIGAAASYHAQRASPPCQHWYSVMCRELPRHGSPHPTFGMAQSGLAGTPCISLLHRRVRAHLSGYFVHRRRRTRLL
jgi:hypothetical protein